MLTDGLGSVVRAVRLEVAMEGRVLVVHSVDDDLEVL